MSGCLILSGSNSETFWGSLAQTLYRPANHIYPGWSFCNAWQNQTQLWMIHIKCIVSAGQSSKHEQYQQYQQYQFYTASASHQFNWLTTNTGCTDLQHSSVRIVAPLYWILTTQIRCIVPHLYLCHIGCCENVEQLYCGSCSMMLGWSRLGRSTTRWLERDRNHMKTVTPITDCYTVTLWHQSQTSAHANHSPTWHSLTESQQVGSG